MKKFGFILAAITIGFTSCIKVDVDNSTTGGGTVPPGSLQEQIIATKILTGNVNEPVELPKGKYTLKGYVYVNNRATLRFAPGSIIVGDTINKGALIVEQNARLYAEGTAADPIVFTSGKKPGQRKPGDWGGIVLLGNAPTNRTTPPIIEGGINAYYGGSVVADNSGSLKYVRIEFAGIAADPNSEINGLTLGGVGSGTTLDHIQVSYGNDDAYEFFGGTVNSKYLIAFATADDDYDFDFGFNGRLQFGVALRDPLFVDGGDAGNGVESDNDASGTNALPYTKASISNFTWVGPNDAAGTLANHNFNMRWRRASQFDVRNSILMGYMDAGLSFESDSTANFYKNNISGFKANLVHAVAAPFKSSSTYITAAEMETKAIADGCAKYTSANDIMLANPFNLNAPDFMPKAASPALAGANFIGTGWDNIAFWTKTTFRGAFGTDNWTTGWTSFTPQANNY
ncbi:MAG TPA: hypothetical protein VLC98_14560 [Phnomibacter sp.]|nr:hypothetical protein [Phnomibacter sp.]